jgi:hypothetical protein
LPGLTSTSQVAGITGVQHHAQFPVVPLGEHAITIELAQLKKKPYMATERKIRCK